MSNKRNSTALDERRYRESPDSRTRPGRKHKGSPEIVPPSIVQTDFAELGDGSLVEMIEDPENPSRALLAVYKDGEVHYTNRVNRQGRVFVPISRSLEVVRHVRLPRGAKRYESVRSLLLQMKSIFSRCIELPGTYSFLLANFVLSTWLIDRLTVAPYVALVGLPGSGKTTLLRILRLLCRRSLLTADITSAAFYRVRDRLTPTLLIDETATAGDRRKLLHLLRSGTTSDMVALRKDQSFRAYGAKVVSWRELPDDAALNSRCIVIPMREAQNPQLTRPSDPEILEAAEELQKQLLLFRLSQYRTLSLPRILGAEVLGPRVRDLFEALAFPSGENSGIGKELLYCFAIQQEMNLEPLSPPQAAVLHTLFDAIHRGPPDGTMVIGNLTSQVNDDLRSVREGFRLKPRKVGAVLSSLGITNRTRTRMGLAVWLDREAKKRIHDLVERYGIDNLCYPPRLPVRQQQCEFCEGHKAKITAAARRVEGTLIHLDPSKGFLEWLPD